MPASIFNGDAIKILKNKLRFKDGTEITSTEAGYLAGTTSDIQTQLDAKASTTLNNLGTTAINADLLFSGTNKIVLPNNVAFTGLTSGAVERALLKVRSDDDFELGNSGGNMIISSPNVFSTGTLNLGTGSNPIDNLILDQMGDRIEFQTDVAQVRTVAGTTSFDMRVLSGNASAGASGNLELTTGSGTTATGNILLMSGGASAGNSGNITLETGSATGTRGKLFFEENTLGGSSVGYAWTLQNVSTGEGGWQAIPSAGNRQVATYSTTATASGSDEVILLSGASFTLTLPTASGITGKIYEIIHDGTSLSQVYTIDGNGAETIRGATTFLMHTNGQRVRIVSDGTNWKVLDNYTTTDVFSVTLTPNNFGTVSSENYFAIRQGNKVTIWGEFTAGTPAAAIASLTLPSTLPVDTTAMGSVNLPTGSYGTTNTNNSSGYMLYVNSSNTIEFGSNYSTASPSLTSANANTLGGASNALGFKIAELIIDGWEE